MDVLVSTERAPAAAAVMALADAELLGSGRAARRRRGRRSAGAGGPDRARHPARDVRQAVYLTAADNFAREIRLLVRPPGDPRPPARRCPKDSSEGGRLRAGR